MTDIRGAALTVPISRFHDHDIGSFDFDSWGQTFRRYEYRWEECEKIEALTDDIERNGLKGKIELMKRGQYFYVGDGHHRIAALMKMGWTDPIPYRWTDTSRVRAQGLPPQYERDRIPEVALHVEPLTFDQVRLMYAVLRGGGEWDGKRALSAHRSLDFDCTLAQARVDLRALAERTPGLFTKVDGKRFSYTVNKLAPAA